MKNNRLRCPDCGLCYEGDVTAKDFQNIECQGCGKKTGLVEEDPDGLLSGALPPVRLILPGVGALLVALIGIRFSVFNLIVLVPIGFLLVYIVLEHVKLRKERIWFWERIHSIYSKWNGFSDNLQTKFDSLSLQHNELLHKYHQISPERHEALSDQITRMEVSLKLMNEIDHLRSTRIALEDELSELKKKIVSFENEEMFQSFGFYKPLYDLADSAAYRQLLEKIRDRQKTAVKDKTAVRISCDVPPAFDKTQWKKITKNIEKMLIRAFNGESDSMIDKVTFSNLDSIASRIKKAFQTLNELCEPLGATLSQPFLNQKLEELHVAYEYQRKIKEEREEQKKIREEMREQARLLKEIEDAKKKIEKEEIHFNQVITELQSRMESAAAGERVQYEAKLNEYKEQLAKVMKDKEEVIYREQSTRAGYVYIISNIGSFGEHTYKIGVTRRLDPQERIDELGDASVPFEFDVHALIFSENAPALEKALHECFADRAVNKVNSRKEFFKVTLQEIEEEVKKNHNEVVEFTRVALAEDYRLSMAKERELSKTTA